MDNPTLEETSFQSRKNGFEVFAALQERIQNKVPTSLIRLGDGEGTILGFPHFTSRSNVDYFLRTWYGHTHFSDDVLKLHKTQLKEAISAADIIGIPRTKQIIKSKQWASVEKSLLKYKLIEPSHIVTDTAIHRYLTFALLYRALLHGQTFLGLISCRDVVDKLKSIFKIENIAYYPIRGESKFPGSEQQAHFPDRFNTIEKSLFVPFLGAIFFVGAGVLGKTYCKWIKERGGIAIDIGSIFDAWDDAPTRTKHPVHKLERYKEHPTISLVEACNRYNLILDEFQLDGTKVTLNSLPSNIPLSW